MYVEYYNMSVEPFSARPKTDFFFASPAHQHAIELLKTSIEHDEPVILVYGEYGIGKTLTCLKLLEEVDKRDELYLFFSSPDLNWREVLYKIAERLGIEEIDSLDEMELQRKIFDFYAGNPDASSLYLIFDDFQETEKSLIYHIKKILNFNVNGFFPIKVILIAHTSFLEMIKEDPLLEPFMQRLRRRIQISPLSHAEMREYIYFRLFNAGAKGRPVFSDGALAIIKRESRCIPRLINNICDLALIVAYRKQVDVIDDKIVREAIALYNVDDQQLPGGQKMARDPVGVSDNDEDKALSYEEAFGLSGHDEQAAAPHHVKEGTPCSSEGGGSSLQGVDDAYHAPGATRYDPPRKWHSVVIVILLMLLVATLTYLFTSHKYNIPIGSVVDDRSTMSNANEKPAGVFKAPSSGEDVQKSESAVKGRE
jgi:type II secretory pathway predicted ATPase ExeA